MRHQISISGSGSSRPGVAFTRLLVMLVIAIIALLPSCHRSGSYSDNGSVVVIEDPCLDSPLPSYPPGYPLALLELLPFVAMEPQVPQPPDGISCLPSVYLVAPPLPAGLALDEVTGTISGTPEISGTTSEHVITAVFPDATEDFLMTIIVLALPPAFIYPQDSVDLIEQDQLLLDPELLPGSGPIENWSVETPGAPPLSAIVDTLTGQLALFGSGNYTAIVTGTNNAGDASFSIEVTTLLLPRITSPLLFVDDGDGVLGVGDHIHIETTTEVQAPSSGADTLTMSAGSSLGSGSVSIATGTTTTLISIGEGAVLEARGAADAVGATSSAPLTSIPSHGTPGELVDLTTGLPLATTPALDLFPGLRQGIVGTFPTNQVIAADLDADGRSELVAITEGQLLRLERDGSGNWASETIGGSGLVSVAASDIDDDGDLDLIAVGAEGVFGFNNDAGSFNLSLFDANAASRIVIADLDRDGDDDLLVARSASSVEVFAGDGSGNFVSSEMLPVDGSAGIVVIDLDRDGYLDVATAEPALLKGDANGLTPWSGAPLPDPPCSGLVSIDTDRADGWQSLVWLTADDTLHRIDSIGGSLEIDLISGLFTSVHSIDGADLDRDGGDDLLLIGNDGIRIHPSRGALPVDGVELSSRAAMLMTLDNVSSICTTDLDADGDLDVIAAGASGIVEGINGLEAVIGSVSLQLDPHPGSGHEIRSVLATGDIQQDGYLDRVVAGPGSSAGLRATWLLPGSDPSVALLLVEGADVRSAALVDVERDGDLDIVLGVHDGIDLLLIQQTPTQYLTIDFPGGHEGDVTNALQCGDVDGDGIEDLVQGCYGLNRIWIGDGAGSFGPLSQLFPPDVTYAIHLDDLDGDGDLDLVSGNSTGRHNRLWINDGSGIFSDSGQILGVMEVRSITSGDIDQDGDADLVLGMTGAGSIGFPDAIWHNDGSGHFSEATSPDADGSASLAVALGDLDLDGDLDLVTAAVTGLRVQWNLGGFFSSAEWLASGYHDSVQLLDVDGDGDLDLQSASAALDLETWIAR
ncbi:MAG: VCBS repeat-containing protein [Planctomycetota bacterium]|nr:VCBS repeat-containing protein [Planctomycetota bacterium]